MGNYMLFGSAFEIVQLRNCCLVKITISRVNPPNYFTRQKPFLFEMMISAKMTIWIVTDRTIFETDATQIK